MPSKRAILDLFLRNELLDLADRYSLAAQDRRVKNQIVDAAAASLRETR